MPSKADHIVHIRVISRVAPIICENRTTEFGLQDRDRALHPGKPVDGGFTTFAAELPVARNARTGLPRFRGPFVHNGSKGSQYLYIGWRHSDTAASDNLWINRLKVHLNINWDQVLLAHASNAVLETDCTGPEWGVLKNWHGLNAGREWTLC